MAEAIKLDEFENQCTSCGDGAENVAGPDGGTILPKGWALHPGGEAMCPTCVELLDKASAE